MKKKSGSQILGDSSIMMGVFLRQHNQLNFGLYYKEMHMCMYAYVRFVIFFSFFAPLGPLRLIIALHFPKKVRQCHNAMIW